MEKKEMGRCVRGGGLQVGGRSKNYDKKNIRSANPESVPTRYEYSAETTTPLSAPSAKASMGERMSMSASTNTMNSSGGACAELSQNIREPVFVWGVGGGCQSKLARSHRSDSLPERRGGEVVRLNWRAPIDPTLSLNVFELRGSTQMAPAHIREYVCVSF
ncbi:hypothetical protein T492DRAFT_428839 [Pavlovales sp. CCMP2436]|nr:hypothetical protein T492DRAFT_428839 [Pavlovales sp. CCMP2436]